MIYFCCTPAAEQDALLAQAKASGARIVRLDVELNGIVRPAPNDSPYDFSKLDRLLAVARQYRIRLLGVLGGTSAGRAACPPGVPVEASWKCPPADPDAYARDAVAVMEHAGGA